jgi:hypothetical protein
MAVFLSLGGGGCSGPYNAAGGPVIATFQGPISYTQAKNFGS